MNSKLKKTIIKAKQDPVFFAENFLQNKQGENFKLERHQKDFLRDPAPYRLLECSRRSGKSLMATIDLIHKLFFQPMHSALYAAPSMSQAKEFSRVLEDVIRMSPIIRSSFTVLNKMEKELANGSRVAFATVSGGSGREADSTIVGRSLNSIILDEIQSMNEESLSTVLPALVGQSQEKGFAMTALGTPRGRSNLMYSYSENSFQITEDGITRQYKPGGLYSKHRFQICEMDEEGNITLTKAPYRLPIKELEAIKSAIGVQKFRREFLLAYDEDMSMPYYESLIRNAGVLQEPTNFASKFIAAAGIDFGKTRNNSVLTVATFEGGVWQAKYYHAWPLGTEYQDILHFLNVVLPLRFPFLRAIAIDATGVGLALTELVNKKASYDVIEFKFTQQSKVNLVEACVASLESQHLKFAPHPKLTTEMEEYQRTTTDSGRIVFEKGASDDFVDSFNLCNWAIFHIENNGLLFKTSHLPGVTGLGQNTFERERKHNRTANSLSRYRQNRRNKK